MKRTRAPIRRPRWAAGLTAAITAAVLSVTAPAQAAPEGRIAGAGEPGSVGGSYLVTLREGTAASSAEGRSLAARYGARIGHIYSTALNGYAVQADETEARRLAADSRVASVSQDTRITYDGATGRAPQDPPPWGLDRVDQAGLPLDDTYTSPASAGKGVTVYVIDTGIRISHRDFGGRASYGWDFVGDDRVAGDGNGHGTHVAATIAGTTFGVAKKARVVSVRVLDNAGGGTTAQVIAGIDWVTRHARKPAVANVSLGGNHNAPLDAAVRNSIASGVTYTVAAGNDGQRAGDYSPADVREAITVGATGRTDARADFSNWGPALDLFAPGVSIISASYADDTGRATYSGTSMAAPHVAGAAALYLAERPKSRPAQVARALTTLATSGKVFDKRDGSPNKLLRIPLP
ncbi:S8 family peptidase [Streptomyces sp. WI04-05B]|uniref:S8 family peptidase n=1 Tax=Streptomyces TaxID=1883 RepID=UPI0029A01A68|nr:MULTISPECIES: S8 family peptidase [unclassified Streptomyces]MDX2541735.1 S8 family peptidase [Streptomyces sp. WI04-05B]MDX2586817.1 S8 family peptidase [Streptomyces sp. WI04-05A]MDX3749779.1 S8 family peptidase [Streptomyces sp. AK08-02]